MRRKTINTSWIMECTIRRVLALIDTLADGYPEWSARQEQLRHRRRRRIREDEAFDDHMTGPTWRNIGGVYEDDP